MRTLGWDPPGTATLDAAGEELMLARLVAMAGADGEVPPGDDAAGWRQEGGTGLISTDSMVEGVHFRRGFQSPYQLGRKAWAQAASDLAAMGAWPLLGVVAAVFPGSTPAAVVEAVQLGLVEAAEAVGASVVGGDLSSGPVILLSVTVVGSTRDGTPVRLGGARPGDLLVTTGRLGCAAAALAALESGDQGDAVPASWVERLLVPTARLEEGEQLRRRGCSALTDLSDGLLLDAGRMARASGVAVELWADRLCPPGSRPDLQLVLTGGEDYELLAAVPSPGLDPLLASWPADLAELRLVGSVAAGQSVVVLDRLGGSPLSLGAELGYQHFRSS